MRGRWIQYCPRSTTINRITCLPGGHLPSTVDYVPGPPEGNHHHHPDYILPERQTNLAPIYTYHSEPAQNDANPRHPPGCPISRELDLMASQMRWDGDHHHAWFDRMDALDTIGSELRGPSQPIRTACIDSGLQASRPHRDNSVDYGTSKLGVKKGLQNYRMASFRAAGTPQKVRHQPGIGNQREAGSCSFRFWLCEAMLCSLDK
ncbi:hypothetical protein Tco_1401274 [Tanacetum coccineum]